MLSFADLFAESSFSSTFNNVYLMSSILLFVSSDAALSILLSIESKISLISSKNNRASSDLFLEIRFSKLPKYSLIFSSWSDEEISSILFSIESRISFKSSNSSISSL